MPKAPPSPLSLKPERPKSKRSYKGCMNCRLLRKPCTGPLDNDLGCQECWDARRTCLGFPNGPVSRSSPSEEEKLCSQYMKDWNPWRKYRRTEVPVDFPTTIQGNERWLDLSQFSTLMHPMSLPTRIPPSPSSSAASSSFLLPVPSPSPSPSVQDLYNTLDPEEMPPNNHQDIVMSSEPYMWTGQSQSFGAGSAPHVPLESGLQDMAQYPTFVRTDDQQAPFSHPFPSYSQESRGNAQNYQDAQLLSGHSSLSFSGQQEYAPAGPSIERAAYSPSHNSGPRDHLVEPPTLFGSSGGFAMGAASDGFPSYSVDRGNYGETPTNDFVHRDAANPDLFVTDHDSGLDFNLLYNGPYIAEPDSEVQLGGYTNGQRRRSAFDVPSSREDLLQATAQPPNQATSNAPGPFNPNSSFAPYEGLPPLNEPTEWEPSQYQPSNPMWAYAFPALPATIVPSNAASSDFDTPMNVDLMFNPIGESTHAMHSTNPVTVGNSPHQDLSWPPGEYETFQPSIQSQVDERPRYRTGDLAPVTAPVDAGAIDSQSTVDSDPLIWREEHRRRNGSLPSVLYTLEEYNQPYHWDGDAIRRKHAGL